MISDTAEATRLRCCLEQAMSQGAANLSMDDWKRKPWLHRVTSWLAYGLVRLMIGLAGYGGQH